MSMEPCALAKTCLMDRRCVDYHQCAVEQATEVTIRADERAKVAEQIAAEIERNASLWEDYGQHPDGIAGARRAASIAREVGRG